MPSPANWISVGGLTADLGALATRAQALATLAQHWEALAARLASIAAGAPLGDVGLLAGYLAAHLGDEPVRQAFADIGLGELHRSLLAQRDQLGQAGKLLQPINVFGAGLADGAITLSLPTVSGGAGAAIGPAALRFDVGLQGGLGCEAGAAWPFTNDGVEGGLLRLGGQGGVTTKAGLSLPLGQFGGSAHADAAAALALSLFFRPTDAAESYASALLGALSTLPSPLDLASLDQVAGFAGLALSCDGSVSAGLALSLGKSFDLPQVAAGKVGITADLSFQRKATWVLSLRRAGDGLRFVLSRDELRERNWSAGVDITLDAAPLARRVHDMLIEAESFAGPAFNQIKPFLSPGTYLATQAAALLKATAGSIVEQPQLREALLQDLSLVLGKPGDSEATRSSALAQLLSSTIADLAATHGAGLVQGAETWAKAITADLFTRFPPLAAVASEELEARIKPLVGDVIQRFTGLASGLANDPVWSQHLGSELSAAGAGLAAGVAQADQLLASTRSAFMRFFGFAAQVTQATADDTKAKLSARFGWSGTDSSGLKFEMVGTFTESNAETANLWHALVTGNLAPFQMILADPSRSPAGLVLSPDSSLSRFADKQRGFAAEITVLGIDVSLASIVKGEASITRNAAGDISVTAQGSALRQVEGFGEGRSAGFMSSWDLLMLKSDTAAGVARSMAVDVAFDHDDKDLEPKEVQAMLAGLSEQGLIEPGRVDQAQAIYQSWRVKAAGSGKVSGRIGLRLRLPAAAAERMVAIGRMLRTGDNAALLAVFDLAIRSQLATGVTTAKQFDRDLKQAIDEFTISHHTDEPTAYLIALWNSKVDLTPDQGNGTQFPALAQLIPRAGALVTLLRTMAEIYDAVPTSDDHPTGGAWTQVDYADAEKRLVAASRAWLRLNQSFVFFFKSALHPALLAFLRLLVALARPQQPGSPAIAALDAATNVAANSALFRITMREGAAEPEVLV